MKNKFIVLILTVSLFFVSGCAKKDSNLPATSELKVEAPIYFTQGAQTNDETIPWIYRVDPEENKVDVEWVEWIEIEKDGWLEAEQTFRVHTADLLTFNQSGSSIEFSYLDEEDVEAKKVFEVLSDSIVQDENNKRYEW